MNEHDLKLATEPFNAIASGKKTIESRLFDEKRKLIKVGDTIKFTNREQPDQTVSVKVIGLLKYETFEDLFSHNDPRKFGGPTKEWLLDQVHEFYSRDDELVDGVIGIEFVIL
jgi:ASC-1-like (ASCH) protein